ncbi:hydantoinase B/oxoprolinase family protein [Fusibacter paucivorans]|uniref:Hydantoinase B/oxoprolinase family protein n=1 Tax=Fusibacter paucivorans TaxID=76009 RepID=A0ABS5PQS1_9FIRM|nr:hydantoinase B/oxoprolinase family protein [Fusibacter paucivorans]MBS7527498.1 hydantoinase B/oxoprolinase family protein [Fusibacter paucivorans]
MIEKNNTMDQFTLDIIKDSLYAIGEEMFIAVARSSKSPVIYETLDFASALTDAKGNLLTQGNGVTGFIGLLSSIVKATINKFGIRNNILPGDVFIINDPYIGGGSHLSDVGIVTPIFYQNELVAFSANKAHWTEVGGKDPGSWGVDTNSIFQEGLQFPCVKLFEQGKINESVMDIIRGNVRYPDLSIGDLWAQIAGNRTGEKRFVELCDKYGKTLVMMSIERLLKSSEILSIKEIQKLPKGDYYAEDFIDDDGVGHGPFLIKVKVTVTEDSFICDFTGSHPQVPGPINSTYYATVGAVRTMFLAATNPSQDINDGVFKPLKVIAEEGSIFNAQRPAPISTYWESMSFASDLIWKALAPILPDRLTAGHLVSVCGFNMSGIHPDTGEPYLNVAPNQGGWGAGEGMDGQNAQFCIGDGETYNIPAEVLETRYGFIVESYSLLADGMGKGEYRGGSGVVKRYRYLNDENYFTGTFGRNKFLPWGMNDGGGGSGNRFRIIKKDGTIDGPFGKYPRYPLREGDCLEMIMGTGGGYGHPYKRPIDKVLMDYKNEFISLAQAETDYGVIINPDDGAFIALTKEREAFGAANQ